MRRRGSTKTVFICVYLWLENNLDCRFSSTFKGTMTDQTTILSIQNVSKTFDDGKVRVGAVEDFSLEIFEGELVCIVGSSGCGKSTLLNMLAGFIQPTAGKLLLHNEEIVKVEPRCGMIFQAYALFPWKTVRENIEFGLKMKRTPRITVLEALLITMVL